MAKMQSIEEMAENVANRVLDEFEYKGKSLREWVDILAQGETDWIPCNVRMPEEHEWLGTKRFGTTISNEVYVTFETPKGERFCKHVSFQNGKLSGYDQRFIDAICKGSRPIAWKPLPEPCREVVE